MKRQVNSKDWPQNGQRSVPKNELERELTKALDQSSADLSDRFDAIVRRYKHKDQIDHSS